MVYTVASSGKVGLPPYKTKIRKYPVKVPQVEFSVNTVQSNNKSQ